MEIENEALMSIFASISIRRTADAEGKDNHNFKLIFGRWDRKIAQ